MNPCLETVVKDSEMHRMHDVRGQKLPREHTTPSNTGLPKEKWLAAVYKRV